jgi:hypothetical protein
MPVETVRLNIVIPETLDRKLRQHLLDSGRREKGAISHAFEEALTEWLDRQDRRGSK